MAAKCPNGCQWSEFIVTAHITQIWKVNEEGDFLKVIKECEEVTHFSDKQDVWTCVECGAEAIHE